MKKIFIQGYGFLKFEYPFRKKKMMYAELNFKFGKSYNMPSQETDLN